MPRSVRRMLLPTAILLFSTLTFAQQTAPAAQAPATAASREGSLAWTNDPAIEQKVEALLKQMTLEEKIGQTNQFSQGQPTGPGTGRTQYEEMVAAGKIGSIFNLTGAKETNAMQRVAMERSRLKIPLLFGLDVIHGYRTTFPIPLALSATWNTELVQRTARAAAVEAAAEGVRWTFSPMVDIARDARWGRIIEGAGEDPYLGSLMARAYVRGYQGTKLSDPASIAACAKHYVGYGAAEGGRDYNTTEISERLLRDVYLPPFKAAVDSGAATLMSAFNALNGVPTSANPFTLGQVLRQEWGFRGFVVSDWTSIKETIAHGTALDLKMAARKSFNAGVDMDMESAAYLEHLGEHIKSGAVSQQTLDESVRRILRVKFALGLFDQPYVPETTPGALDPQHVQLAREAAEQSFVLLKNGAQAAAGPLPLANVRSIALIGPLADAAGEMIGAWGAKGDAKNVVTLKAALADYGTKNNVRVVYEKGVEIIGGTDAGIAAAVNAAKAADVVLLAVGENAGDMTAEAASRAFIGLPGLQPKLLEAVAESGKPVVLLVFSGRPLALTPYVEKAAAVVQAWHPGIQAGPAMVNVLTGAKNFSGRLTASFPRSVGQLPLYYNHMNTGRPAGPNVDLTKPPTSGESKYVTRYIDEQNAPLYPFGYGLSYTKFEYSAPTISAKSASAKALNGGGGTIRVTATVRNIGNREGVEVAQLYISQRGTSVVRPVRELKGFQRLVLKPGESRQVEFTLAKEELAFWNIDLKNVVEPAAVTVWIGPDAHSGGSAEFTISD